MHINTSLYRNCPFTPQHCTVSTPSTDTARRPTAWAHASADGTHSTT